MKTIVLGPPGTGKTTTLLDEVDKYLKETMSGDKDEKFKAQLIEKIPINRLGEPKDVANACLFLSSEESDFIESLPFGGDDAVGLVYDGTVIDQVGSEGDDPGAGWAVAGIEDATKNHTLVRHPDVLSGDLDWENSAMNGWIVYDQNVTEYLGYHEVNESSVMAGDTNFDGIVDILDIVRIINQIIGNLEFNDDEFTAADLMLMAL